MSDDMIIQILTGPVAALALCIFAIYYIARWLATHVPVWVNRHLDQFDKIVESHNEDRKAYQEGLETLNTNLSELGQEVDVIKDDVKDIKREIKARPIHLTPPEV